ncbi:Sugar kinase of the NBD/HSP70 family, may contain an N-terminal HTH domain [Leifsonia sp. 98AMF]|nr:Sugar kinase of the NBD/HSP70 family, may contain an N-terminal HTH domain [Leifsonia sp. 197AMF]SDJ24000.1 Sugar kinase of the NBD/HSP70 family, may contain an N-terminal HTH domain [Leifsonia sp. 466MF]SDK59302.1 Sugar kinase of the NBD/HSP70 family, may contain an N-terminal HTH domain [Leifsonia sp. 157MF]SDN45674.1 Sugar kinase of the NBD/HSP70 family, may contain an N-terminal HTH domain [Leifsonia sp. 509MF]SEN65285.1 Sugar kinase of the NBD/HSP70 family, may contain an N-terminal HTH
MTERLHAARYGHSMSASELSTVRPSSGGATDALRRSNLATVLGFVHRDGALSRSDLTRLTGLNRSTVGDLVAELAALDLVEVDETPGGGRAGRPSPVVRVSGTVAAVAVNPEVDAVIVGLVGLGGRVLKRVRIETASARSAAETVTLASAGIAGMLAGESGIRIAGIGVAVPGQVRLSDGMVREATHFGWVDEPLAGMLSAATGHRVWAANAAVLGLRAESAFGAGRGVDDLVYMIGGASGIGGGAIGGGRLLTGAAGYAGEFGHTFVRSDGRHCSCGSRGCLEAEVTQAELLASVGLASAEAASLADRLVATEDPAALAVIERDYALLSIAARNAVNVFNPSLLVLGGFLAALYRGARAHGAPDLLDDVVHSAREGVTVVEAELGTDQLLIGAAELVLADLIADPARALAAA